MTHCVPPNTLIVNFNAPELNALALHLAQRGRLAAFVRPYLNKGRWWERLLAMTPLIARPYASTFGRRRFDQPELVAATREAGVVADIAAAVVGRWRRLPADARQRWIHRLHEGVRAAVAREGERRVPASDCVVGYPGFAGPAFKRARAQAGVAAVLNYPIAHHRYHRRIRAEEIARRPAFASTWTDFEHFTPRYEAELDEEIALADTILVGSRYARDSFAAEGLDVRKLAVVEYGVDLDTFTPPLAPRATGRFEVLFVGQMSQRKGLSYLLDAYRAFEREDTALTLVGNFPGSAAPLAPYADQFTHVPNLARPELARRYQQSDVFVFPTLLEGMGLVVLEAMACGLPVIVTDHGPGALVRDGIDGFVIPSRDENAISDRLERLYRDRGLCREMGRNASQRALEFSWRAYAGKVANVLAGATAARTVAASAALAAGIG